VHSPAKPAFAGMGVASLIGAAFVLAALSAAPAPAPSPSPPSSPSPVAPTASALGANVQSAATSHIEQVWPVGPLTAWAWTGDTTFNGLARLAYTASGGRRWISVTPPRLESTNPTRHISDLCVLDATHAWVAYGGVSYRSPQTITATSDRGRSWKVIGQVPSSYGCTPQFVSPQIGWCVELGAASGSELVTVYRTHDGGAHWRQVSMGGLEGGTPGALPFGCDKNVAFVSPTEGWAPFTCNGGNPIMFTSIDGGATWNKVEVDPPTGISTADGYSFNGTPKVVDRAGAIGANVFENQKQETIIHRTVNGGAIWKPVVPPGRPTLRFVDIVSTQRWCLVAGDRILITRDGGRTWSTMRMNVRFDPSDNEQMPPAPALTFVSDKVGWILTSRGLWRTVDGGAVWRPVRI
jgi:photosystem II stability/assembly factor-like uncharacterized protein